MLEKEFIGHDVLRIGRAPVERPRPKRIDLVVTDYDGSGDGVQKSFRCTIPLAILNGAISGETLREVARFCRPAFAGQIGTDDFLNLIETLIGSLRQSRDEPLPEIANEDDHARIAKLTPRERQVLAHVVAGDPNKITAAALNISRRTVEHHRAAIMQKTRTKSVCELVRLALRTGLYDVCAGPPAQT